MMDKAERNAVWRESVERFGMRLQSIVCMEECAELIQAVSKRLRGRPDPEDNLAEEMADVYICLKMLQDMYGVTDERLFDPPVARRGSNVDMRTDTERLLRALAPDADDELVSRAARAILTNAYRYGYIRGAADGAADLAQSFEGKMAPLEVRFLKAGASRAQRQKFRLYDAVRDGWIERNAWAYEDGHAPTIGQVLAELESA